MTPIIVAAAVAALIVIGAGLVLMSRSRRDDEGERFRRVADLTSRWSRQVQPGQPGPPGLPAPSVSERGVSVIGLESESASEPEPEPATGTRAARRPDDGIS